MRVGIRTDSLTDDGCGPFTEVERHRGLVGAQVVGVEDELLREILLPPPHDPPKSWIHEAVLVAGHVNRFHQREPEVPHKVRVDEGRDEAPRSSVHVDGRIPTRLHS